MLLTEEQTKDYCEQLDCFANKANHCIFHTEQGWKNFGTKECMIETQKMLENNGYYPNKDMEVK